MEKRAFILITVSLMLFFVAGCAATSSSNEEDAEEKKDEQLVTIYSPHQTEIINPIIKEFEEQTGIRVDLVTGGSGELLNRIQAEGDNPLGDVLWGPGAESLEAYKDDYEPYETSEDANIPNEYKSPSKHWVGFAAPPMVIMYNKDLVDEAEVPESWEDLLDPKWKGKIAFTDPAKSGSAYTQLVTMLLAFQEGDEKGWDFVEKFVDNLDGKILSGSSMVYQGVSDGEFPLGITLEKAAYRYIAGGSPVDIVYPSEGTAIVPDGTALIKGAKHKENAQKFIDFTVSKDVQELISSEFHNRSIREDIAPPEGLLETNEIPVVDYDFEYAAENRDDIMKKFQDIVTGR